MKDRLWTKQYLLVIVTNFLLYVVYYQLMLWTTSYAMHVWKADVSEAGLAAGLFIISALVARLLAGHFIDGLGRGFVLRCGTALYAASMLLYFFITCGARVCLRACLYGGFHDRSDDYSAQTPG